MPQPLKYDIIRKSELIKALEERVPAFAALTRDQKRAVAYRVAKMTNTDEWLGSVGRMVEAEIERVKEDV